MQPQSTDASLPLVVCADLKAWRRRPERYWRNTPEDVRAGIVAAIGECYERRPQVQRDEAMRWHRRADADAGGAGQLPMDEVAFVDRFAAPA